MKLQLLRAIYKRYMAWRLAEITEPEYPILLEYRINTEPRYGYGKPAHRLLEQLIDRNRDVYAATITAISRYGNAFSAIAREDHASPLEPTFYNTFFSGLDAMVLYTILGRENPGRFFEIGSGNSTRFARRAIRDLDLRTKIISCDPRPRVDIADVSDEVIRERFEDIDLSRLDALEPGDILFIDSSHRCFTNSDVTVQFLDVLPGLKRGVTVHFHDILLPYDYPPAWATRFYSEQYLLACLLLGGAKNLEIVMPNAFVSADPALSGSLEPIWKLPHLKDVFVHSRKVYHEFLGFSFWLRKV